MKLNQEKKLKEFEMTEKEKDINNKGIHNYLEGKLETNQKVVPGFHKTDVGRYNTVSGL